MSSSSFNIGDEVVVVKYPDTKIVGNTGVVTGWDGRYWNVDLDVTLSDDEDGKYLFETKEIELINNIYKYNPDQTGDTEDDV